jgi:hypothetical protein
MSSISMLVLTTKLFITHTVILRFSRALIRHPPSDARNSSIRLPSSSTSPWFWILRAALASFESSCASLRFHRARLEVRFRAVGSDLHHSPAKPPNLSICRTWRASELWFSSTTSSSSKRWMFGKVAGHQRLSSTVSMIRSWLAVLGESVL